MCPGDDDIGDDTPECAGSGPTAELSTERVEGFFSKHQVPGLLVALARRQRSGRLAATEGATVRTIGVAEGLPVFAVSTATSEHFGRRLVERGFIASDQWATVDSLMRSEGMRFGEALVRLGMMTPARLKEVLDEQRAWIVGKCLEATRLRVRFRPADIVLEEDVPVRLLSLVEDKIRAYSPSDKAALAARFADRSFALVPDAHKLARRLYGSPQLTGLLSAIPAGAFRLRDLMDSSSGDALHSTALTLILTGLAIEKPTAPASLAPLPVAPTVPAARPTTSPPLAKLDAPHALSVAPSTVLQPKVKSNRRPSGVPAAEMASLRASYTDDLPVARRASSHRLAVPRWVYYAITVGTLSVGAAIASFLLVSRTWPIVASGPASAPSAAPVTSASAAAEIPALPRSNTAAPSAPGESPPSLPDDNAPPLEFQPRAVAQHPEASQSPEETEKRSTTRNDEIEFRLGIARKLLDQHNYVRALEVAHEVLKIDPRNAGAYRVLGIAYSYRGARDMACECYRRYLRFAGNPTDRSKVEQILQTCTPSAAQ
jgi:hypothetical protein